MQRNEEGERNDDKKYNKMIFEMIYNNNNRHHHYYYLLHGYTYAPPPIRYTYYTSYPVRYDF